MVATHKASPQPDHALLQLINPFLKSILENTPDPNYGNLEEKRVTTGSEQSTTRALGEVSENEVTRTDHSGFAFQTDSPLSNKPLNEKVEFVIYGKDLRK